MATRVFAVGCAGPKVHGGVLVLIPAAIFLASCANQQHPDAQAKEDKAAIQETTKEIESIDDARCQSFGLQPGTSGYTQCRKEIDSERSHMGIKE
jgi:hypothetical protein